MSRCWKKLPQELVWAWTVCWRNRWLRSESWNPGTWNWSVLVLATIRDPGRKKSLYGVPSRDKLICVPRTNTFGAVFRIRHEYGCYSWISSIRKGSSISYAYHYGFRLRRSRTDVSGYHEPLCDLKERRKRFYYLRWRFFWKAGESDVLVSWKVNLQLRRWALSIRSGHVPCGKLNTPVIWPILDGGAEVAFQWHYR